MCSLLLCLVGFCCPSTFLLVLSFPDAVRGHSPMLSVWTGRVRVLWFCFRHTTYLAKSLEKCSVGVCSCPAAKPGRGGAWVRHWSCRLSYQSVLPALSGSELQLFKSFLPPVPFSLQGVGLLLALRSWKWHEPPVQLLWRQGSRRNGISLASGEVIPAIAWRVWLQVKSICNASVSKDLLEESL